jgi:uncharacterized phage protein (TIGR02218 family)
MAMDALGDALTADLTTLAVCWRVVRSDGIALGFTTHDRPLIVSGMRYDSAPGMVPSAIVGTDDLEVDGMDIGGALTADAITGADLAAGRYDDAAVTVFLVDWRAPDAGRQVLARGHIGEVQAGGNADGGFVASLRGPTAALAVTAVESSSPECRAELGDRRCGVAMRGRVAMVTVAAVDDVRITLATTGVALADHVEGRLRVLDGPEAGLDRRIVASAAEALIIDESLSLVPGTRLRLWQGCDKRFATCVQRFGNAANFRGEPHVPGGDILTRFGG